MEMSEKEILERLKKNVIQMDVEGAKAAANEAMTQNIDPLTCIEKGLSEGMKVISDMFDNAQIYVPQIIISAEAFTDAVGILAPHVKGGYSAKGKIILHTVEGDIHDIGKNIVAILLQANGYEVIDLGRDVLVGKVVDAAVENDVDCIGGSALMTTTMPAQREIVNELKERGIRDKFKCLFGGAPTSQEWVDQIGADGWAENAAAAVDVVTELID
jgi:trimethylamine corrinoid protein